MCQGCEWIQSESILKTDLKSNFAVHKQRIFFLNILTVFWSSMLNYIFFMDNHLLILSCPSQLLSLFLNDLTNIRKSAMLGCGRCLTHITGLSLPYHCRWVRSLLRLWWCNIWCVSDGSIITNTTLIYWNRKTCSFNSKANLNIL